MHKVIKNNTKINKMEKNQKLINLRNHILTVENLYYQEHLLIMINLKWKICLKLNKIELSLILKEFYIGILW